MEARGNPEHSMKSDISVQVKGDGVRRIITGVLSRPRGSSAGRGHHWLWRKVLSHSLDEGWSLSGFLCGLMLASLYGVIALILQNQPLWFCVHSTLVVALPTAFSMGLFAGVRADVMVMLPSMFSARGRHFLLFLFTLVLLTGPVQNTLENTERAAASLLCGAEQAANQTQELLRRASTPLLSALDKIREITSKAYAVVNRVHRLIYALTDGVRHVARILRNVLHFLVQIGDVCNEKLGSPYRKCRSVFNKGHADCVLQLGEFSPLCDVIKVFMPLCSLTRAAEFFCIIPSYIAEHLKEHLADPVVKAFQKMKREFEFNITATATFDLEVNSSLTLQQMTQDIMAEVSSDLHRFQDLSEPLKYVGLLLLLLSFIRAARYRRRYLSDLNFDNIYMTAQFEKLDQKLVSEGAVSVWPITRREATTYITPLSLSLSRKEKKTVLVGVASVVKYLVVGGVLVALDFLVFWILDQVRHQLTGDVVARAPVVVSVQVNGSGYASDIFRDLVSSFNVLQTGNITVISGKCLLRPLQPDYYSCLLLGFLMGLSLVISVTGGFVKRSRRLVCAAYYPQREEERIQFLRQQILDLRRAEGVALRRSAVRSLADRGEGGGEQSLPEKLLLWFPGGSRLSRLVGMTSTVTCVSCGEELRANQMDRVVCDVPQCPGENNRYLKELKTTYTINVHRQPTPSTYTVNLHHQRTPSTYTINVHHQRTPSTYTINLHRQPTPSTYTINIHRQRTPSTYTINLHRQPTPSTYTVNLHRQPTPSTYTINIHRQPTPSTYTINLHHQHTPSTYTINLHHQHTPSTYTINLHHQPTPSTYTVNLHHQYLTNFIFSVQHQLTGSHFIFFRS